VSAKLEGGRVVSSSYNDTESSPGTVSCSVFIIKISKEPNKKSNDECKN
jgi:hypothetical protein